MQKEMYDQHEDREHFEPIVGGNDNEWETESEHDIENWFLFYIQKFPCPSTNSTPLIVILSPMFRLPTNLVI